jgi:ectoine hydroxylase-related dioxygenase (phytanoyl-CoA dioxygenase family)
MASCLIAVDRATKENGCLQVLKGSHKIGRIDHAATGDQKGAELTRVEAAMQRHDLVYCEMEPGDALFFHGNLLHSSSKNESDRPRWSLICCYNTRHNDPFIQGGRHPNYSPLEMWPDDQARSTLLRLCQASVIST